MGSQIIIRKIAKKYLSGKPDPEILFFRRRFGENLAPYARGKPVMPDTLHPRGALFQS